MKVLFICKHIPAKTGNGCAVHLYGIIKVLETLGMDITLMPVVTGKDKEAIQTQLGQASRIGLEFDEALQQPKNLSGIELVKAAIVPSESDYCHLTTDQAKKIKRTASQNKFDFVMAYDWESLPYCSFIDIPKVAFIVDLLDDYFSLPKRRMGSIRDKTRNLLRRLAGRKRVASGYKHLSKFDTVIESASHYIPILKNRGIERAERVPHPMIPPNYIPYRASNPIVNVLIPGSLKGAASLLGFKFFFEELLPELERTKSEVRNEYRFRVIGHGSPPDYLTQQLATVSNLDFIGFAEDISSEYDMADIVLVNIPISHGYRTRIAEVFGHGRCVIAHEANCSGMPEIRDGENALTGSSGKTMARKLAMAISDPNYRESISANAKITFDKYYDYRVVAKSLAEKIGYTTN